ncbi:MAG: valine--tRNA ligase [Rickettsiales bacterium]|jgi:valyl-tRNA synthetase|nr:valine--tRNA ligase [Rickettsiales bacterium]
MEFPKKYNHKETEIKWQNYWTEHQIYQYDSSKSRKETYVIDTPPPTVSGMLHMGHVFSYTQADFIARYQRMKGKTVFYPMGFDDNGLPTERLVEKVKKIKGSSLPRDEFVKICKEVVVPAEEEFRHLFKSIALSVDWNEEYQTISDKTRLISQLSFLDLYDKNSGKGRQLERKTTPCYFDCYDNTALAQADLEDKEQDGVMNDIIFKSDDGQQDLIIATTRPELIPACVALLCHPEDERYQNLIGKKAITALFNVKVPIIADDLVEMEKGTGLVMCCTFGDVTDIEWQKKHNLQIRSILNKKGLIKDFSNKESDDYDKNLVDDLNKYCDFTNYQEQFNIIKNQHVTKAKNLMIDAVKAEGRLVKQTPVKQVVKCAERSGKPIEILVTPQWFIKVTTEKEKLLEKAEAINWYPNHMKIRMQQWIEKLSWEWCISRQRFFGVPFPVWYVSKINSGTTKIDIVVADKDQLPVDPLYDLPKGFTKIKKQDDNSFLAEKDGVEYLVTPEKDIMDTWATSSVTPQISSRGINAAYHDDIKRHNKLFPADLRPQAHEIIRSWAFYTLVKAHHHEDKLPWYNMMISGWCLASDKTKMSKSKGNVITPVTLIQEKSSDLVRFWASTSHLGSDTAYSEDVVSVGKKLINKLWNAAKFASINLDKLIQTKTDIKTDIENGNIACTSDLWILSRLKQTIAKAGQEFDRYEYAKARDAIESFFWNDFCDNYLEIAKARSYGDKERLSEFCNNITDEEIKSGQISSLLTLSYCLENILKLFAPFIPHITEELYQIIFYNSNSKLQSIHQCGAWPNIDEMIIDDLAITSGNTALNIIDQIRKDKSDHNFSIKQEITKLGLSLTKRSDWTNDFILDLKAVNNIKEMNISDSDTNDIKLDIEYKIAS